MASVISGVLAILTRTNPVDMDIFLGGKMACLRIDKLTAAKEGDREFAIYVADPRSSVLG